MPLDIIFPIRWQDVVDILVISFILNRLFLFFRGTIALQITGGILSLWLFHEIAQAVGLVLSSLFFQGISAITVIVIVVVFQDEIRAFLVQNNPVRFFLGRSFQNHSIKFSPLYKVLFQLAENRTGALIVFKRRDKLDGYLREGIAVDSKFSPEIIASIFAKQSPIHDGAIIIKGNRIATAGTFLPLTQKEGLPQRFGTRHRAALGLSDRSDAVVVVISEERGEVSIVHRGVVTIIRDHQLLEKTLNELLLGITPDQKHKKRLREWLTQSAGLLLTFLLVATFWGIYSGKQYSLINVTLPVDFRNIPDRLELKEVSAEKINVQITGNRRLVSALNPDDVRTFLDLKEIDIGTHNLVLGAGNVEIPLGLKVVRITPPAIKLEMELRIEKELEVKPNIVGFPPIGYQISKLSLEPEFVKVSGPNSILRAVRSLFTEPINLGNLQPNNGKRSINVPIVISPASLRLLDGQKKSVNVRIDFQPHKLSQNDNEKTTVPFHIVQDGESLYSISRLYGLTVKQLQKLNKLFSGAIIYPGQKLRLTVAP
jgi:uncharacterized protein (TIGR00159 family)